MLFNGLCRIGSDADVSKGGSSKCCLMVCVGLGVMPTLDSLAGLPTCSTEGVINRTMKSTHGEGEVTLQGSEKLVNPGVFVGEGRMPVPRKVAEKIWKSEFVDKNELMPECYGTSSEGRSSLGGRRARAVSDIFTWIQCFSVYVSVQSLRHPEAVTELMAYMALIVRASQDFKDLAWLRYDVGFRRQAALTSNRKWSTINTTMYSMCFTTSLKGGVSRCELCLGTSHTAAECALQGEPDPDLKDRVKTVEATLLALAGRQQKRPVGQSSQVCRLFNAGKCHYSRCKYVHECEQCRGPHPSSHCQLQAPFMGGPNTGRQYPPRP